jgi:CubicO group peptidase (beta-lactamase class C family)
MKRSRARLAAVSTVAALLFAAVAIPAAAGTARAVSARSPSAAPSVSAAVPAEYASTVADARAGAAETMKTTGSTALSIALVDGEKLVWSEGFGIIDKESGAVPAVDTRFGIASVSKMFAAVAVMRLVERGKLELDAPLIRYLPAFRTASPDYRQITVRMLLDHSAGLPGTEFLDCQGSRLTTGFAREMLGGLSKMRLRHTPGLMNVYTNDGATVIESLVAAVSGKSYSRFVTDEIVGPLGMTRTAITPYPFAPGTFARCYAGTGDTPHYQEFVATLGSGGVYSTPSDMARLAAMFAGGGTFAGRSILSTASVAAMATDQTSGTVNPVVRRSARFGLGWDTVADPGLETVGVTGWTKGGDTGDYHSAMVVAPAARLGCVVLGVAPLNSRDCEALAQRILLHALVDKGVEPSVPATMPVAVPPLKNATVAEVAGMTGYWASKNSMLKVTASPSRTRALTVTMLEPGGGGRVLGQGMRLRTDGRFWTDGSPASARRVDAVGRSYIANDTPRGDGYYRDEEVLGQKVLPGAALSAAWRARVGRDWLLVNEKPWGMEYGDGPVLSIGDWSGLPGYLGVNVPAYGLEILDAGAGDDLAVMFLQIPGFGSVDQNDLTVLRRGGQEWMRFGSMLFRPAATVPTLPVGAASNVLFGREGYAEWRSFPTTASVSIAGATAWRIYDASMVSAGDGSVFPVTVKAPGPGSRLLLFGPAGGKATVRVTEAGP